MSVRAQTCPQKLYVRAQTVLPQKTVCKGTDSLAPLQTLFGPQTVLLPNLTIFGRPKMPCLPPQFLLGCHPLGGGGGCALRIGLLKKSVMGVWRKAASRPETRAWEASCGAGFPVAHFRYFGSGPPVKIRLQTLWRSIPGNSGTDSFAPKKCL